MFSEVPGAVNEFPQNYAEFLRFFKENDSA